MFVLQMASHSSYHTHQSAILFDGKNTCALVIIWFSVNGTPVDKANSCPSSIWVMRFSNGVLGSQAFIISILSSTISGGVTVPQWQVKCLMKFKIVCRLHRWIGSLMVFVVLFVDSFAKQFFASCLHINAIHALVEVVLVNCIGITACCSSLTD